MTQQNGPETVLGQRSDDSLVTGSGTDTASNVGVDTLVGGAQPQQDTATGGASDDATRDGLEEQRLDSVLGSGNGNDTLTENVDVVRRTTVVPDETGGNEGSAQVGSTVTGTGNDTNVLGENDVVNEQPTVSGTDSGST